MKQYAAIIADPPWEYRSPRAGWDLWGDQAPKLVPGVDIDFEDAA